MNSRTTRNWMPPVTRTVPRPSRAHCPSHRPRGTGFTLGPYTKIIYNFPSSLTLSYSRSPSYDPAIPPLNTPFRRSMATLFVNRHVPPHILRLPTLPHAKHRFHGPNLESLGLMSKSASSKDGLGTSMMSSQRSLQSCCVWREYIRYWCLSKASSGSQAKGERSKGGRQHNSHPPKRYVLSVSWSITRSAKVRYVGKPRVITCDHLRVSADHTNVSPQ